MSRIKTKMRTKMKNNKIIWISALIAVLILGLIWADRSGYFDKGGEVIKTDTVFSTKTDTLWRDTIIVREKPVEKKVVEVRRDTVLTTGGDTLTLVTEHKTYQERLISEKDTADLEIYTTGIETSLDSLKMRLRTHTEVVTNTVEITKYIEKKRKFLDRFHFTPNVSAGYGIFTRKPDIYVGIGVGFEL